MTLYTSWADVPPGAWPYRWFTPKELACKGTGELLVNHDAIARLERMRDMAGKPFIITSAYRSPMHNARVGGRPMSFHKFGRAFDIRLAGHNKEQLIALAGAVGFGGIEARGDVFLHVDTGRQRTWNY